jgi:hypothetical protein
MLNLPVTIVTSGLPLASISFATFASHGPT